MSTILWIAAIFFLASTANSKNPKVINSDMKNVIPDDETDDKDAKSIIIQDVDKRTLPFLKNTPFNAIPERDIISEPVQRKKDTKKKTVTEKTKKQMMKKRGLNYCNKMCQLKKMIEKKKRELRMKRLLSNDVRTQLLHCDENCQFMKKLKDKMHGSRHNGIGNVIQAEMDHGPKHLKAPLRMRHLSRPISDEGNSARARMLASPRRASKKLRLKKTAKMTRKERRRQRRRRQKRRERRLLKRLLEKLNAESSSNSRNVINGNNRY